jgi:hypothetical protein
MNQLKPLLAIAAISLFTAAGCKKDSGSPKQEIKITDAKSLNDNMEIGGAKRVAGNIPSPTASSYPIGLTVNTPSVIITPGNTFNFELESAQNQKAMIVYVQIDGTDEHFEITYDVNGSPVMKTTTVTCGIDFKLKGLPAHMDNMTVDATVQVYQPDKQYNGVPDLSGLNDWKNWSPKKKIQIKTFNSGTGDIFATLTWNKEADIDLWMIEPNGNKIYYANTTSSTGGELDYDNVIAYGPENIFYKNSAPSGQYKVWVHYYSGSNGPVNWVVSLKNGATNTNYRGTLQNEEDSILVASFTR